MGKNKNYKRIAKRLKGECIRAYDRTEVGRLICSNCKYYNNSICRYLYPIALWCTDLRFLEGKVKEYIQYSHNRRMEK